MKVLCECDSFDCKCQIDIDEHEYLSLYDKRQIIISNVCKIGPKSTDTLVERRENYSIYEE